MKYVFSNEALEGLTKVSSIVAVKDSSIVLNIGYKDLEKALVVSARVTTPAEELTVQLTCEKPADWDGKAIQIAFNADKFQGVINSLLSFKEKIFLVIEGTSAKIGVEGKAQVPVEVLSEIPKAIDKGATVMSFACEGQAFTNFVRKGLSFTAEKPATNGAQNAVLQINASTGELVGLSTDGNTAAKATMQAKMASAPEGNAKAQEALKAINDALDAFCEKNGQSKEKFTLCIPGGLIAKLKGLAEGLKGIRFEVTEKNLVAILGNAASYTMVQGAVQPIKVELFEKLLASPINATVQFDTETLIKGVDFVNKINGINGEELTYGINLEVGDALVKASSGAAGQIETSIKVSAKDGGDAGVCVRGKYFKNALSSLQKGNMVVKFSDSFVLCSNGTLASPDDTGMICILLIKQKTEEKPAEEAEVSE